MLVIVVTPMDVEESGILRVTIVSEGEKVDYELVEEIIVEVLMVDHYDMVVHYHFHIEISEGVAT